MQRTLLRSLLIVVFGVAAGLTVNAIRWDKGKDGVSRRLPYITPPKPPSVATNDIALTEAKALWDTGTAFFLDARASTDYVAVTSPTRLACRWRSLTARLPVSPLAQQMRAYYASVKRHGKQ